MRDVRGFSLIELLVTIGVVALLLGIALPALSGARERARGVEGLSNLRQTGVVMGQYVEGYGGWLPYASEGTSFHLSPPNPLEGAASGVHWMLSEYWSSLFFEIAPWEEWFALWTYPDPRRTEGRLWNVEGDGVGMSDGVSSLRYSRALYARPEVWAEGAEFTLEERGRYLRGVRMHEAVYPSGKVSLFDGEICARIRCDDPDAVKRGMLFLDGHAAMHAFDEAREGIDGRDPYLWRAEKLHDTVGGVKGRDF